jgi:ABC-type polysaccharide/polyol phosphate transport system ATPase subunit
MSDRSTAVEVRDLSKAFCIPRRQANTFKERVLHPRRSNECDPLQVLDAVSFDVGRGEFFGIVGRNGSGKSTLLKCLAGIYRADAGRMRVAGRLAPFIELGVGFNPNLAARDNVVLNAVMMGLTPAQARARFHEIIAFAELEDFVDLELKNYSSGMQVRLAFAVMLQSDAEVLLIDEVLAVGDAAFQQKCLDEFGTLRESGRTVVLVTHDMSAVERFCHKAMLLKGGRVAELGDPQEVALAYLALNFEGRAALEPDAAQGDGGQLLHVEVRPDPVAHGQPIEIEVHAQVDRYVADGFLTVWLDTADGARAIGYGDYVGDVSPGDRVKAVFRCEQHLLSGHYYVGWSLEHDPGAGNYTVFQTRVADLVVFAGDAAGGLWAPTDRSIEVTRL